MSGPTAENVTAENVTAENVIAKAVHAAFIIYPEGDGGPNLDHQWIRPEQSTHLAKVVLLELAANGFEIVKRGR